jgi:hypothetical protein
LEVKSKRKIGEIRGAVVPFDVLKEENVRERERERWKKTSRVPWALIRGGFEQKLPKCPLMIFFLPYT